MALILRAAAISAVAVAILAIPGRADARIVFASFRDSGLDVWRMNDDGSDPTKQAMPFNSPLPDHTWGATEERAPAISADGEKIAFNSGRGGGGIWVTNVDGSDPVQLTTNGGDTYPTWSPDGTRIAFYGTRPPFAQSDRGIYVMDADGTDVQRLSDTPDASDSQPSWSPDGTRIAFRSDRPDPRSQFGHSTDIWVRVLATGEEVRVTDDTFEDESPDWSPDGTQIVWDSNRTDAENPTDRDIYRKPPTTGGTVVNVTATPDTVEFDPTWSPDGSRVAFAVPQPSGNGDIYSMGLDGTERTALAPAPQHDEAPDWGPGGTTPPDPEVSIDDQAVDEGSAGSTTTATFTVSLSAPATEDTTVGYATADRDATAPDDYEQASGTVTFAPGESSKTISVNVRGDALDEANEQFEVNLSDPQHALLDDSQGIGTISDDDDQPTISIADAGAVAEGDSGTRDATFTVSLSAPSGRTVTVLAATADGTATEPADYEAAQETLTFNPGDTSETFSVPVVGDTADEPDEGFTAVLVTASSGTLGDAEGAATITDDDSGQLPPAASHDPPPSHPAGETVPPPPDPVPPPVGESGTPPPPQVRFARGALKLARNGTVPIRVSCAHEDKACRGTVSLYLARAHSAAAKRVRLGRARFKVRAGATRIVRVKLSRRGRRIVARKRKTRVSVTLVSGGSRVTKTVTLKRRRR